MAGRPVACRGTDIRPFRSAQRSLGGRGVLVGGELAGCPDECGVTRFARLGTSVGSAADYGLVSINRSFPDFGVKSLEFRRRRALLDVPYEEIGHRCVFAA